MEDGEVSRVYITRNPSLISTYYQRDLKRQTLSN